MDAHNNARKVSLLYNYFVNHSCTIASVNAGAQNFVSKVRLFISLAKICSRKVLKVILLLYLHFAVNTSNEQ